jgi:hypothetical protein
MRQVVISASIALGLALSLTATVSKTAPSVLTVIRDFKGPHPPASIKDMERESEFILKSTA